MEKDIRKLEPKELWNHFADLNAIPRASKKEQHVIDFIKSFGENLGLETLVDPSGNVIIKKPASKGNENKTVTALQSHLDMVHQKNSDTNFNFDTQGIDMYVDGDWVKAKGTTLGADNGIGVASIMTILASKTIEHPPLEALFTIDEETGMTGALGLKGGLLNAKIMLNLDTEEDNELTIGCAGGIDVTATGAYQEEVPQPNTQAYVISLKGLTGGHSGTDIHRGRANANKLMNRILYNLSIEMNCSIASIDGGSLRNAIPRESKAVVVIPVLKEDAYQKLFETLKENIKKEYHTTDPDLNLETSRTDMPGKIMNSDFQYKILRSIYACPNGIYRMSPDIENLVQTSNNVARVLIKDGACSVLCLSRSSVDSEKMDVADSIRAAFELSGLDISFGGGYPGWTPRPDSEIVKLMSSLYKEMFREEPHVLACHAGLECGIIGAKYPETEMISFGPCIRGAHSPDEKAQISSVQKYWKFLLETLKKI